MAPEHVHREPTLADRLKRNRYIAGLLLLAAVVVGLAQVTGALQQLGGAFSKKEEPQRATYRRLDFDLVALATTLENFSNVPLDRETIQGQGRVVLAAADPVCAARGAVADLGDAAVRQELDAICSNLETFRNLTDPQFAASRDFNAKAVVAQASAAYLHGRVTALRESVRAQFESE